LRLLREEVREVVREVRERQNSQVRDGIIFNWDWTVLECSHIVQDQLPSVKCISERLGS